VTDWRLGLLFRGLQLAIVGYVVGYSIILQKSYQKRDEVMGTSTIKIKGAAYTNGTSGISVFDAEDLVNPPTMQGAFFVTTRFHEQIQRKNEICSVSPDNSTNSERRCQDGCIEGESTFYGIMTGKCGMYGYCEIQTWCPLENKSPESQNLMIGISNFSAFIRTNVQFPLFGITLTSGKDPVRMV